MGPTALAQVLRPLAGIFPPGSYPDLLQGLAAPDDAAVWRIDADRALVMTADFFPPLVDDPYDYGTIAAANSLSDVYAMGAEPVLALNLVGFPDDLDPAILGEILRGGAEKVHEAGAVIAGGHTTTDREPKYGLAAIGWVHPDRIWTKAGAQAGDVVFLTKPLGTGILTTALKRDRLDAGALGEAVASMKRLHQQAARLLRSIPGAVHAVTDITGFGLIGHGHEVAQQSGVTLALSAAAIPRFAGIEGHADGGCTTGGGRRNEAHYAPHVTCSPSVAPWERQLFYDPQTSGGLLIAVAAERAEVVEHEFRQAGEPLWRIGELRAGRAGAVEIG
jgi:selenide,water dikinase